MSNDAIQAGLTDTEELDNIPTELLAEKVLQLLRSEQERNPDSRYSHVFNVASKALEQAVAQIHTLEEQLAGAQELQELDALTSVKNRRGFNSELNRALKDERRLRENQQHIPQKGVVLLMIDMDRFKPINDTHGHNAGDHALIKMTEVVQSMIRPLDTLARLGGDEFAVILPHTTTKEISSLISNITKTISELEMPWEDKIIRFGGTLVSHDCNLTKSGEENYTNADLKLTRRKDEKRHQANVANSNVPPLLDMKLG